MKTNKFNNIYNKYINEANDAQLTTSSNDQSNTQLATSDNNKQSPTLNDQSTNITDDQLMEIAKNQYEQLKTKFKDNDNAKQAIDELIDNCINGNQVEGSDELINNIKSDLSKLIKQ